MLEIDAERSAVRRKLLDVDELQRVARFGWAIAAGCVVVMAVSFRRRQFALFQKKTGGVGLDLCDAGPDRARFEAFVREIQKAIRNA